MSGYNLSFFQPHQNWYEHIVFQIDVEQFLENLPVIERSEEHNEKLHEVCDSLSLETMTSYVNQMGRQHCIELYETNTDDEYDETVSDRDLFLFVLVNYFHLENEFETIEDEDE